MPGCIVIMKRIRCAAVIRRASAGSWTAGRGGMMNGIKTRLLVAGAGLAVLVGGSAGIAQSGGAAPEARYVMDAGTIAGMMGQGDQHELTLRLGSRLAPTGGPAKADHFMPPAARLGASVPLEGPIRTTGEYPEQFRRPKGRLL